MFSFLLIFASVVGSVWALYEWWEWHNLERLERQDDDQYNKKMVKRKTANKRAVGAVSTQRKSTPTKHRIAQSALRTQSHKPSVPPRTK